MMEKETELVTRTVPVVYKATARANSQSFLWLGTGGSGRSDVVNQSGPGSG